MIIAALPTTEAFRLVDLASYDIMDTLPENDFDELVELAGQICNCPISFISLLDKDRQWFKSKKGIVESGTSRDVSFCAHTILEDDVMVVEDTTKDARFMGNPFVTGDAQIRFYAGAPIVTPGGNKIGTICILDTKVRKITKEEERALTILSNQVIKLLELRKKNMLIRQRSEEIITVKSKAISTIFRQQEADKRIIATNIHEDLAQGIASSIFYIRTAEHNQEMAQQVLSTAREQLQDVLVRMQDLSYAITPYTQDLIPAKELVVEYAEKIAATYNFEIRVEARGADNSAGTPENALSAIRIIEEWLKVLAERNDVSAVTIIIQPNDQFEFLVEDNGRRDSYTVFEKEIFDCLVYEMAAAQGGTIELSLAPQKNLLKIRLPLLMAAA